MFPWMRSACVPYPHWFKMFKSGQSPACKDSQSNVSGSPARSHSGLFSHCVFVCVLLNGCFPLKMKDVHGAFAQGQDEFSVTE